MFVVVWGAAQAKRGRVGLRLFEAAFVSRPARETFSGESSDYVDASSAVCSVYCIWGLVAAFSSHRLRSGVVEDLGDSSQCLLDHGQ
jgi:hypothetical protein